MKSTPGQDARNKKDFLRYGFATLGLVLVYAGLMTVDMLDIKALSLSHLLQSIN
jgi:hypothetical protein